MTLYKWSQTAASDATADSTINWSEGQAPSSVNDSARAMMAATAKYRDDIAGAIVTGGTSTAFTVSSYEVFDTLAHLGGQMIAFTPHVTNGATVTLNVDSLGAKPLRTAPNTELLAGMIVQGTPYVAVYNNTDGAFYLQGFYGNPYNVPLAGGLDYWGTTVPNSSFAFPAGQAISRTTYASLFAIMGTIYGSGDGSTTFNLPDKTGRVSAMKEDAVLRMTTNGWDGNSTQLGSNGDADSHAIARANFPNVSFTVSGTASVTSTTSSVVQGTVQNAAAPGGSGNRVLENDGGQGPINSTGSINGLAVSGGSGVPLGIIQPTIICNYIIRIL